MKVMYEVTVSPHGYVIGAVHVDKETEKTVQVVQSMPQGIRRRQKMHRDFVTKTTRAYFGTRMDALLFIESALQKIVNSQRSQLDVSERALAEVYNEIKDRGQLDGGNGDGRA